MDLPTPVSRPDAWRTTAMVAAAVAAFELVLLVLIALAFLGSAFFGGGESTAVEQKVRTAAAGPKVAETPAPAAKKKENKKSGAASKPAATLSRAETSVMVLNGNGIDGAAAQATEQIRRFPYLITGTGNAPRTDFERSLVMYRPGFRREAVRFARDLGIGRVAPLDGMRPSDLQGAKLALIVGAS